MGKGIHNHSKHIKTPPFILLSPLLHNSIMLIKSGLIITCDSRGSCHILLRKGRVQFRTIEHLLIRSAWFDQTPAGNWCQCCKCPRAAATTCTVVGHHQPVESFIKCLAHSGDIPAALTLAAGPGEGDRNQQPDGFNHALHAEMCCWLLQGWFPSARALGTFCLSSVCLDKACLWEVIASDPYTTLKLLPVLVGGMGTWR